VAMDDDEADPTQYKVVSVRLREAEYLMLARQAAELGLTHNLALRIAARRIGGFLEIDPQTRALLQKTLDALGELSRNIRQLKAAYSESGAVDMKAFARLRAEFGREFSVLDARLCTILNVSHSRRDGRLILKEEAES